MRFILSLLIFMLVGTAFAQEDLPISGILNPDFAAHLATITTLNDEDVEGIFIIDAAGEVELALLRDEIVAASNEYLGGFLTAYDESGQALFELADGGYQMQFSTGNGSVNFSYLNQASSVQTGEMLTMESDVLLEESSDGFYQVYLLTTGELAVVMGPDEDGIVYHLSFTGIPALNIKTETSAD